MARLIDADALEKDLNTIYFSDKGTCLDVFRCLKDAPTIEPKQEWISTEDRMPEEHDSIFARFYGTDKWSPAMFRTTSYDVIVCLKYEDGKRGVKVSRTQDGKWNINTLIQSKVTHWMPLPGALMED